MEHSESIKEIAIALGKFQHEVGKISKSETNPFFKSKYAGLPDILSAINEPLHNSGLSFVQFPSGENMLTTMLMHESGEWMKDTFYMKPTKQDPQSFGSVITYQRRYALGAILGLNIDEDDDGNKASQQAPKVSPLQLGLKDIINSKTIDELQAAWARHKSLQGVEAFIIAKNNKKKEL